MKPYKDKCDSCGKFDILKGHNGICLCSECLKKKQDKRSIKQFTIFDKEVRDDSRKTD